MKHLLLFMIALLLASPAIAGECHIAIVTPLVSDWTITVKPGGLIVDAKLVARVPALPPGENYGWSGDEDDEDWWYHFLGLRPAGATGFYKGIDMQHATVTDSTFHFEVAYPAGTYEYHASIGGYGGDPQECGDVYEWRGTLTIVDPTPARRVSWGAVKGRWR